jgi:hypothetical protein
LRARNRDGIEVEELKDHLLAGHIAWEKQMTLEGLVARKRALLRFLARSRAEPLDREVPLTMLHAGARFFEGPETAVNAAVQILFGILGQLGASGRARIYFFRTIVGIAGSTGGRRRGFQLLVIAR